MAFAKAWSRIAGLWLRALPGPDPLDGDSVSLECAQEKRLGKLSSSLEGIGLEIASIIAELGRDFGRKTSSDLAQARGLLLRARDLRHKAALVRAEMEGLGVSRGSKRGGSCDDSGIEACSQSIREEVDNILSRASFPQSSVRAVFERAARDLLDGGHAVRRQAIREIGATRLPESVRLLEVMLGADDDRLRQECLEILADFKAPCVREVFRQFLASSNFRVRRAALRGLYELGGQASTGACLQCLADTHPGVRELAAMFLGWQKARAVAPALEVILRDEDREVRAHAAKALGELCAERSVFALICSLRDGEPRVRGEAKAALEQTLARDIEIDIDTGHDTLFEQVDGLQQWWTAYRLERHLCDDGSAFEKDEPSSDSEVALRPEVALSLGQEEENERS